MTEHFSSLVPIQLLGRQLHQERNALQLLARCVRSRKRLARIGVGFSICTSLAVILAIAVVVGYGGHRVITATMTTGTLVAFYTLVTQLFDPLSAAADLYARAQKAFASVRQLQATFDLVPSVFDSATAVPLRSRRPEVEFVEVEFGYGRQRTVLSISALRIPAGEKIVITGENGAGKSTLVKLIARIYDVDSGCVRIGGFDIRGIRLDSLRRAVCYLPREAVLFSGTLASNLRFVCPMVSDDGLWEVIRQVGLFDYVTALPHRLQQNVGPGGCQLSGGERQRLAIARACLQRPQILILDEATSCLDSASEANVLDNLQHAMPEATLLVVSHRASTISGFRRMLVLSKGRVIEDANPSSFTSASAAYSGLFTV